MVINFRVFRTYIQTISLLIGLLLPAVVSAQFATYNHPELEWKTFETEHFEVHYHQGAEWTAQKSAEIAESVYGPITTFYNYEPDQKTDLIIKDIGDISNGAAYYFDNKIEIWATPLDYPLRGNHHWLLDVISHEFSHIVSLAKSMKFSRSVPGFYFQVLDYEDEKRDDVIYGYPRVISSYPIPGVVIPMWLAEGMAQYMWPGTSNDFWDSHRDMLMRDRVLSDNVLSFTQMASFGKRGIGNESTYNQGYAFVEYLAERFGPEVISNLAAEISRPVQFSIDNALKKVTGVRGDQLHTDWVNHLENQYQ
ncbi:biopolymer transporter Tol, partial [bacterium]|nr:biopolymer transporter Tol [bacterium]